MRGATIFFLGVCRRHKANSGPRCLGIGRLSWRLHYLPLGRFSARDSISLVADRSSNAPMPMNAWK